MAYEFEFSPQGFKGGALAVRFESLSDMSEWIKAKQAGGAWRPSAWGSSDHARAALHTGSAAMVARSEKLLDAIEAASPLGIARPELARVVVGGLVDVPAFLSGSPVAMRQRRKQEAHAPLTIVVNVASSASIGNDMLERRGAATLALLRKLEGAGHPVELWIMHAVAGSYSGEGAGAHSFVKMETRPLDLARSAWALGSADFSREVIYACNCTRARNGGLSPWPWQGHNWSSNAAKQKATTAAALGIEPGKLLYLPMLYSYEVGDAFSSDRKAVAWVNETYAAALASASDVA